MEMPTLPHRTWLLRDGLTPSPAGDNRR